MGVYRTSVRFDLRNEREKRAADYLKSLKHGEGNRFIVDAVLARIDSSDDTGLVAQIRQMLREEVKLVPTTGCMLWAAGVALSRISLSLTKRASPSTATYAPRQRAMRVWRKPRSTSAEAVHE